MNILVLLHTESDGGLSKASLEALGAAVSLGGPVTIGLVGESVQSAADAVAGAGAQVVFGVEGAEFGQGRYATDTAAAEAICRAAGAELILAPGTSRWMRALPGVAQRIGAKVDSHVVGLSVDGGSAVARRWVYRNRMEATLSRPGQMWVVLLDSGAAQVWAGAAGAGTLVTRLSASVATARTTVLRVEAPEADQQTIRPDAKLLLVAGAGWTKKQKDGQTHIAEAAELIPDLLRLTQASLGSSKSLVDLGSEGEVGAAVPHASAPGRTDGSIAAASEGTLDVLSRRGAARRGVAVRE